MSHYLLKARGSRGEVTRTGSERSGLVAELLAPNHQFYAELFTGWNGDNLRLHHNTQLLYEGPLSAIDAHVILHSAYRPLCRPIARLRLAMTQYAEGLNDNGEYARRILGRTPNAQPIR